ncbi:hypothetical protein CPC08DRAFT_770532 [Agrocybe pediades]|nr:hypothetical protein CPC08DRAFT_770532 [Agrocybe pediades]
MSPTVTVLPQDLMPTHAIIQDRLFYMESRLRVATNNIMLTPAHTDQIWKQKFLVQELQFALSYIGLGYTLGIELELPPLLSTTGPIFLFAAGTDLPLDLNEDIVRMVSTPCSPTDPWHDVGVYEYAWWEMDKAPADLHSNVISSVTIMKCLEIHRAQLAAFTPPRRPYFATSVLSKMIPERPTHDCSTCQTNHALARNCLTELATMYTISKDNVQFFQAKGRVVGAQIRGLLDSLPDPPSPPNADTTSVLPAIDPDAAWASRTPIGRSSSAGPNSQKTSTTANEINVDAAWASRKAATIAPDQIPTIAITNAAPADQQINAAPAFREAAPPVIQQHARVPDLDVDAAWASRKSTSAAPPPSAKVTDLDVNAAWASRKSKSAAPPPSAKGPDLDIDTAWASRKSKSAAPPPSAKVTDIDVDAAWASRTTTTAVRPTSSVPTNSAASASIDFDTAWRSRKSATTALKDRPTIPPANPEAAAPASTKAIAPKLSNADAATSANSRFADIDIDAAWATRKATARNDPRQNKSSVRNSGQSKYLDVGEMSATRRITSNTSILVPSQPIAEQDCRNSPDSIDSFSSITLQAVTDPNVLQQDMAYFDTFVDVAAFGEQVDQGETSDISVEN